jgi:hypothetical protein
MLNSIRKFLIVLFAISILGTSVPQKAYAVSTFCIIAGAAAVGLTVMTTRSSMSQINKASMAMSFASIAISVCSLTIARAEEVLADPPKAYQTSEGVRDLVSLVGADNATRVYEMKAQGVPDQEIYNFVVQAQAENQKAKDRI